MSRSPRWMLAVALWAALAAMLGGIAGCATSGSGQASNEEFTDSDIPDNRRRAGNRLRLAVLYFQDGKFSIALDEVKQAIATDPTWFESYNMRGLVYLRLNEPAQAEASFQRALALNPGSADVRHNYGVMLCRQGRFQDGLAQFSQALGASGYAQRANTLVEQGVCQVAANRKADAEQSFQRAFETDPANVVAETNLAQMLFDRGDLVRAQFHARRVNNGDAASAESLWLGLRIERRLGNREAMQQLGTQLAKRFPTARQTQAWERGTFDD